MKSASVDEDLLSSTPYRTQVRGSRIFLSNIEDPAEPNLHTCTLRRYRSMLVPLWPLTVVRLGRLGRLLSTRFMTLKVES